MSNRFQRPAGAYTGDLTLNNRNKYQTDSTANPKVAISSTKMDGDLNYLINSLNTLNDEMAGIVLGSLPDGVITAGKLAAGAVEASAMGVASVEAAALAPASVTTAALASQAVTGNKIAPLTINDTHVADNSMTADKLASNAVTTGKIASNAITLGKLQNITGNTLLANTNAGSNAVGELTLSASQLVGRGSVGAIGGVNLGTGLSFSGSTLNTSSAEDYVRTTTLSSVANAVHATAIDSGSIADEFILQNIIPSVDAQLVFDVSVDGGGSYLAATNYRYAHFTFVSTSGAGVSADAATFPLSVTALVESTSIGLSGWLRVQQLGSGITVVTGQTSYVDAAATKRGVTVTGYINTAAPITHVRFAFSGANMTSGTIVQHKLRK